MSFNKRFFNSKNIIDRYERGGIGAVQLFFNKIDAAIFEDSFSSEIGDAVYNKDTELLFKLIHDEKIKQNSIKDNTLI